MIEALLALSLVACVAAGLRLLPRPRASVASHWVLGWVVASAAGLLVLVQEHLPHVRYLSDPLATLFPALLLAGTLIYAGRTVPAWLLPAALGFGVLRAALAAAGRQPLGYALALAVEPPAVLLCAGLAARVARTGPRSTAERLLAPAFVLLAVAGAAHLVWLARGEAMHWGLVALWLAAAPPILGLQLQAAAELERSELERARDRLEERVKERTAELAELNASLRGEVSEREAVEAELRRSEKRYRTLAELSGDFNFAFRVDPQMRLSLEWMSEHVGISGLPPGEAARRGWLDMLHPDDRPRLAEDFEAARAGRLRAAEYRILRPDGGVRWLEVQLATIETEGDGSIRVAGLARDVTRRQERRRLEQHVQAAQRLESLGILAGGIAHDFNNLLTVVLGNTRLALEDLEAGSPARGRLERACAAAEEAGRLTDQLLQYSGEASLRLSPCDLSKLVEETLGWLHSGLPAGCRLESRLERNLPPVDADPSQLRELVRHLVTNAGEALAGAAGTIEVRTSRRHLSRADLAHAHGHPDPPPGEYLCLEVADRGHGMDEATRARVFEPFFTTRFPGRGLGLAAVLGIARAHQGVVQVASGVGEGTRVRVLLPCARGVPAETRVEGSPAGGARAARVLVVDDEAWVLDLTREFLERAGFEVVTAVGGRAGLECLRERAREISLVVLDLVMPDLEGEQVLEEMRRLAPEIPVLVATGLGGETAAQARALAGAAGLVRKPFEPEALVGRIRSLLRAPHSYG